MSEKITTRTLGDRRQGATDWARVDAQTDGDIMAAIADDPDAAPPLDADWFKDATLTVPKHMERASFYLDHDVLAWFRDHHAELNWHVNQALRGYAEAHGAKLDTPTKPRSRDAA